MTLAALNMLYVILAAGAAGLYLSLPSARASAHRFRIAGGIIAVAALVGLAMNLIRWIGPGWDGRAFFVIFALIAIVAAVRVVTHRNPVYSAVYFILVVLAATGLCVLAAAEFLAAALVIVYGGAILVTYVFVIMLAQQAGKPIYDNQAREPFAAVVMGFAIAAAVTQAMVSTDPIGLHIAKAGGIAEQTQVAKVVIPPEVKDGETRNTLAVGQLLMTDYVIAVEVGGLLLLVAMMGAISIALKRIEPEALTPAERKAQAEGEGEDLRRRGREAAPF